MKKNTFHAMIIIIIALAACCAGCKGGNMIGCPNNKQFVNSGSGYHQDAPPMRKVY